MPQQANRAGMRPLRTYQKDAKVDAIKRLAIDFRTSVEDLVATSINYYLAMEAGRKQPQLDVRRPPIIPKKRSNTPEM